MSKKQWFLLLLIFIGYLFLGATVFYYLERKLEIERRHLVREEQQEIEDMLRVNYAADAPLSQDQILNRLSEYCGKPFTAGRPVGRNDTNGTSAGDDDDDDEVEHENEKPFVWTFYNSFFFALTTLSTIGYGNLSPTSMEGRMLVIFYSLIGIPLNGIVLSQLGACFGSTFLRAHHRYKTHHFETRLSLTMDIIMYLIPGVVFFIFIPSGFFVYFEGWTYDESVYYAFVTLTTIGYGDFVAGQTGSEDPWYNVYKVLLIVWFLFGLGYLVMILGFIARAMQSKKIARLEQAVSQTLKHTQTKIWKEFTHEVTVVRRALNEMYLLKLKPVYRDKDTTSPFQRPRSRSAPQLTEWPVLRKKEPELEPDLEELEAAFRLRRNQRRQAVTENVLHVKPKRVMSEGDLSRIDRNATFRSATPVEPGLLLARVVDAIGTPIGVRTTSSDSEEDDEDISRKFNGYGQGINMFSDSEILASEWGGQRLRSRTVSEALSLPGNQAGYDEQRTWSGNDFYQYKHTQGLSDEPMPSKTDEKSQSDQLPTPASGLRRMSMAAINFFTPAASKWMKRGSMQKSSSDLPQQQQSVKSKDRKNSQPKDKKRKSGNINNLIPSQSYLQKHRFSLQDGDLERGSIMDEINYLSCTAGRRPSILAALAQEMGPKRESVTSISPVLEQTSVADFIRVLTQLQSRLEGGDGKLDRSATSIDPGSNNSDLSNLFNINSSRSTPMRLSKKKKGLFRSTSTLEKRSVDSQKVEAINPSILRQQGGSGTTTRRRFSFIPSPSSFSPVENFQVPKKFSFSKVSSAENVSQYQKKARSHSISPHNWPVGSSNPSLAMPPVNRRLRRMSSAGISVKRRSVGSAVPNLQKTITPPKLIITSPDGDEQTEHERFTVKRAELPAQSATTQTNDQPSPGSVSWRTVPATSSSSAQEGTDSPGGERKESLKDVVVVRL